MDWVRNRPDGKVEALVEGEQSARKEWALAVRQVPSASRVEGCELVWKPYTHSLNAFEVIQ